MKKNFYHLLVWSLLFCVSESKNNDALVVARAYLSIAALWGGTHIFYKNPNKNIATFFKCIGKAVIAPPLYIFINIENTLLTVTENTVAIISTPFLGIKAYDFCCVKRGQIANYHMHKLATFLFPNTV